MKQHSVYIGIGSNLGNPAKYVISAIDELNQLPLTTVSAKSSLYRTAPINADGDDYVNAVAFLKTAMSPDNLLEKLFELESRYGRERPYPNSPRTLDLDILLYDELEITKPSLILPHPRMTERAFVLTPLLEINPKIIIPGKGAAKNYINSVKTQPISLLTV